MKISLPSIISSGMVLEKNARIWGFCKDHNDKTCVDISFCEKKYAADIKDGKWEVFISCDDYGGPYEMTIGDITLSDVYVGRVFMMSGQSNMETPVSRVRTWYEDDFKDLVDNPRIRAFKVEKDFYFNNPRENCIGSWNLIGPDTVDNFYAISFYISKILEEAFDVPIGLIECAVGGSRIESWFCESDANFRGYTAALLRLCQREGYVERITREDEDRTDKWYKNVRLNDIGLKEKYYSYDYNCSDWPTRPLTRNWSDDIGQVNGSVWFRKSFEVSDNMNDIKGRLFFGTIADSDIIYINGHEVGQTEYRYPPRVYDIPEGIIQKGFNTITIRVVSERGYGGFTKDKEYYFETDSGSISLDGDWAYKIGFAAKELLPGTFFFNYPSGLFNAMLNPVLPYSISAFLWYQGESNGEEPHDYDILLSHHLKQMRKNYFPTLPFLVVQLPNFDAGPLNDNWQIIREKQAAILNHPNTALIVTTDIGEDNDLHPINKKDVAIRLAEGVLNLIRGDVIKSDKVFITGGNDD